MTTAMELVGPFLLTVTLLTAAMFLMAFQLGRLITRDTRDDEQRDVEVAQTPEMAVQELLMSTARSRRARSAHRLVLSGRRAVEAARAAHHPRARWRDGVGALRRHLDELRHTWPSCIAPEVPLARLAADPSAGQHGRAASASCSR